MGCYFSLYGMVQDHRVYCDRYVQGVDLGYRVSVRSDAVAGLSWQQLRLAIRQVAQVGPQSAFSRLKCHDSASQISEAVASAYRVAMHLEGAVDSYRLLAVFFDLGVLVVYLSLPCLHVFVALCTMHVCLYRPTCICSVYVCVRVEAGSISFIAPVMTGLLPSCCISISKTSAAICGSHYCDPSVVRPLK
jgi:hypothetical protein